MCKLKNNRIMSFVLIFFIYLLATIISVIWFINSSLDLWLNILISDILATVVVFIFSVIFNNASIYDPYWSVQPIVILTALLGVFEVSLSFILVFIAICVWGVRLTVNWGYTFKSLMHQDWRYTMLKEKTGVIYPIVNFVGIHMVPTLVVYACAMPAVYVLQYSPQINVGAVLFFVCCLLSVLLQGVADIQMHSFRKNRTSTFINKGLWKYSRHPNYLAEILMWWSVAFYAFVLIPTMWYVFLGAILNTMLFLFVSIPMADNRQSRKEGFDVYKKCTRMLLPLPKLNKLD